MKETRQCQTMVRTLDRTTLVGPLAVLLMLVLARSSAAEQATAEIAVQSPDGRNQIVLRAAGSDDQQATFSVSRDGKPLLHPAPLGPVLAAGGPLGRGARIVDAQQGVIDKSYPLQWSKANVVDDHGSYAIVTLATPTKIQWEVVLRAYDDGVAFRYRLPQQEAMDDFEILAEQTRFDVAGEPTALYNTLASFTTSHETLYQQGPLSDAAPETLLEMPLLLTWESETAAAITEARVRDFAGCYLERPTREATTLHCRLSPLPTREDVCVVGRTPHQSPWRVVLLADRAGQLLESTLLLRLNEPPQGDFDWLRPGKTTWHWWNGEFEKDQQLPAGSTTFLDRHKKYIDFCARNKIAYHAVSGDGSTWYQQSKTGYGTPAPDADVRTPRPEIQLPEILAYAKQRGVAIRLWVHWKPLSTQLEEAFAQYEAWGVAGLMVDFLDRDDQEMIEFTDRMLESAARHKLHLQIHGSSKYSGEQRTFPHLVNREGVLNLEYLKWGDSCTPDHNVNVAYTRALTGPVDYHLGGFRSVSRADFVPRNLKPFVMGTRCHHLALYVVYENPLPMLVDTPDAYEGEPGFDFLVEVPTVWDETRFVAGEPGESIVVARRKGNAWYLGGITNWTARPVEAPLDFLGEGKYQAQIYGDGSLDLGLPRAVEQQTVTVDAATPLIIDLASGGGFVAVLRPK